MKNYQESDYALNKYSPNIVYCFADGRRAEITLEDYLRSNPGKTAEDFAEIKALSDEIYHEQVTDTNRTSRLDVTISDWEDSKQLATAPIDVELIQKGDEKKAMDAAERLLDSGKLTKVQRRRFILHFFKGLSTRQIAKLESVKQQSVWESLHWSSKKLKKLFLE